MAIEIRERPTAGHSYGPFTPKADQQKFRSVFLPNGSGRGIDSKDGAMTITFEPYKDPKGITHNVTLRDGKQYQEYFAPVEEFDQFNQHSARISEANVQGRMTPVSMPATDTSVGRQSVGTADFVVPVRTAV